MTIDAVYIKGFKAGYAQARFDLEQEPCTDAISRQAVIEVIKKCHCEEWIKADIGAPIDALQPVNPAEKVGRWIKSEIPNDEYVCSECGGSCWYYDVEKGVAKSRFCPNCGAKMQEVTE